MSPKEIAGRRAAEWAEPGMKIGLGTGSTAYFAVEALGERVRQGLNIQAVPTSRATEALARQRGIPLIPLSPGLTLDLTIDGADEIDPLLSLIKGGGGALFREKLVASITHELIIIADAGKMVPVLGQFPLPVEIVPFGWEITCARIEALGCNPVLRMAEGKPYLTDNQNYILDCHCGEIRDPAALHDRLKQLLGVVETGLFVNMASRAVIAHPDGHTEIRNRSAWAT
jgi:ribose 5-phosphate isomerase A